MSTLLELSQFVSAQCEGCMFNGHQYDLEALPLKVLNNFFCASKQPGHPLSPQTLKTEVTKNGTCSYMSSITLP